MSKNLSELNNVRTLRAQARNTTLSILEEMLEKLSIVVSEQREVLQATEAEARKKLKNSPCIVSYSWKITSLRKSWSTEHNQSGPVKISVRPGLLNTNTVMKTAMPDTGPVRAEPLTDQSSPGKWPVTG